MCLEHESVLLPGTYPTRYPSADALQKKRCGSVRLRPRTEAAAFSNELDGTTI